MKKYIAFDMYEKNEKGGHQPSIPVTSAGHEVYLASDVDEFLSAAKDVCDYDWSDNDEDAVRAVEKLRSLMESVTK
jgi:hypothetical protein